MPEHAYKRPPITEAVVAIAFATATDSRDLDKVDSSLAGIYPHHQTARNINLEFLMPPTHDTAAGTKIREEIGHRRSSDDQTQIVILWPTSFIFSQLAPYPGWDDFLARFTRDWAIWRRVAGYRRLSRVGVRYINRIDIPVTGNVTHYDEFLNVFPKTPEDLGALFAYGIQIQFPFPEIEGKITINSGSVASPLLNHISLLFDQDISKEANVPQNEEGIYNLLQQIHLKKNAVFEACITDRARELCNR